LWDNEPVWVRLKSVGPGSWTGVVTISERLKETGKRVENPTFVCTWTIHSPKDKGSARR
jgi:hypothetical protein